MIAVAFTVSGTREKYLRHTLDSWRRVRGIEDVSLIFCVEPEPNFPLDSFSRWVEQEFLCRTEVWPNQVRLNTLKNTKLAFERGFQQGADFTVLAEEDIEVATDVLEYLTWAKDNYRDDQDVITVCAHAKEGTGEPWQVTRASWFNPLVCGTWPDRWEHFIEPQWGIPREFTPAVANDYQAWDLNLRHLIHSAGKYSVFPVVSRALHIGEFSTWAPNLLASSYFRQAVSLCYKADIPPQQYREVDFDSVERLIV